MLLLIVGILQACHKVRPQGPANRPATDSAELQMVLSNMQLVEQTSAELARCVGRQHLPYVLYEPGYWALRTQESDEAPLQAEESVKIALQVSQIVLPDIEHTTPVENLELSVRVGKLEVIPAVDDLLLNARHGEEYTMLVPYFCGYGVAGNEQVPPYANLQVLLTIY